MPFSPNKPSYISNQNSSMKSNLPEQGGQPQITNNMFAGNNFFKN